MLVQTTLVESMALVTVVSLTAVAPLAEPESEVAVSVEVPLVSVADEVSLVAVLLDAVLLVAVSLDALLVVLGVASAAIDVWLDSASAGFAPQLHSSANNAYAGDLSKMLKWFGLDMLFE